MSPVGVIVPAAGSGVRMGGVTKPLLELRGRTLLERSIVPFLAEPRVTCIVVALPEEAAAEPPGWLTRDDRVRVVAGGVQRVDSVRAALAALPADVDTVVIHDAARPLLDAALAGRAIDAAAAGRSVTTAVPLADTVHLADGQGRIVATPGRDGLWRAQTPQAFPRAALEAALDRAASDGVAATDEAGIVARYAGPVWLLPGDPANLKITEPADLALADALLAARGR